MILCPRCLGYYYEGYDYMVHQTTGNCTAAPFDFEALEKQYIAEDERIAREEVDKHNGHSFTICTNLAEYLKTLVPNSKVVGFFEEDNPDAEIVKQSGCGGHDFLLVENRYIVDFWGRDVAGIKNAPVVIDLNKDSFMATKWYGDRKNWEDLELMK